MSAEMAIRNPRDKRGRAHRSTKQPNVPAEYAGDTACGRWARDMTEVIPVAQTAPEDRCLRCWAGTPWDRRGAAA